MSALLFESLRIECAPVTPKKVKGTRGGTNQTSWLWKWLFIWILMLEWGWSSFVSFARSSLFSVVWATDPSLPELWFPWKLGRRASWFDSLAYDIDRLSSSPAVPWMYSVSGCSIWLWLTTEISFYISHMACCWAFTNLVCILSLSLSLSFSWTASSLYLSIISSVYSLRGCALWYFFSWKM